MNWVQINIQVNEDFRYMKIHIFALRWRDDIKRSSQLRTLLKRVVVGFCFLCTGLLVHYLIYPAEEDARHVNKFWYLMK